MSVNAVSWAIDRAPVPGARCVARMILVHLADKADADGCDTWKYVSAIADAIGVDDSTVHRNLAWLEEHGLIERGDQSLVSDYPEYARPVVWNLRLDKVREPSERAMRKGRRRAGRPKKHATPPTPATQAAEVTEADMLLGEPAATDGVDVEATSVPEATPDGTTETFSVSVEPAVDDADQAAEPAAPIEASTVEDTMVDGVKSGVEKAGCKSPVGFSGVENPVALVQPPRLHGCDHPGCTSAIHNVHKHPKTINPSAPTGHLPLRGATPSDETQTETETGSAEAGVVVDVLRERRRLAGLSAPAPSERDRRMVARLVDRLRAEGVAEPVALVTTLAGWLVGHRFWAKRVRSGSDLARHFDEIRDDWLIDRRTPATGSPTADSCVDGHTPGCRHVLGVVDAPECRRVEPDMTRRHDPAAVVAGWLNDGLSEREATSRLVRRLGDARQDRAAQRERLAEERKARGGHMFAGFSTVKGGV